MNCPHCREEKSQAQTLTTDQLCRIPTFVCLCSLRKLPVSYDLYSHSAPHWRPERLCGHAGKWIAAIWGESEDLTSEDLTPSEGRPNSIRTARMHTAVLDGLMDVLSKMDVRLFSGSKFMTGIYTHYIS